MEKVFKGNRLTPDLIQERITALNADLHAVFEWKDLDPKAEQHVLVKDNVLVKGFHTTAGSEAFSGLIAQEDAFCIRKIKGQGIQPFGMTTMSELAGFVSTKMPMGYSELGGHGVNPINPAFTPGGSSSGSAIAVAAGFCDAAVGTETHGSIVIPAMSCGIVGVKPTVGLISRDGIIPLAHSFDTPGTMARSVYEAARLLEAMAGADPNDPMTVDRPSHMDLTSLLGENDDRIRAAVLIPEGGFDKEERQALLQLEKAARKDEFEFIEVPYKPVETHYKHISSVEIQGDIDRFLERFGCGGLPSNFGELVDYYCTRKELHPYGFDRLFDALKYPSDLNNPSYLAAQKDGIGNCRKAIEETLKTADADVIISTRFTPWWAIGQAPYIAMPISRRRHGEVIAVTIGAKRWEERKILDAAARIEKIVGT